MIWKRDDAEPPTPPRAPQPKPISPSPAPPSGTGGAAPRMARMGPSITIRGELSGTEDLTIEGRLEGSISLRDNRVTISETGRVKADIFGKSVIVEGEVQGDLYGAEEVVIRRTGSVRGSAVAPQVSLEHGAKFKGTIDMQPEAIDKIFRGETAQAKAPKPSRAPAERPPAKTASAKSEA